MIENDKVKRSKIFKLCCHKGSAAKCQVFEKGACMWCFPGHAMNKGTNGIKLLFFLRKTNEKYLLAEETEVIAVKALTASKQDKQSWLVTGSQSRPANIFVPIWQDGCKTAFKITEVSSLQLAYLDLEAQTPGAGLAAWKAAKIPVHDQLCRDTDISFMPLVVEALGG
jgi:hypothetical protein